MSDPIVKTKLELVTGKTITVDESLAAVQEVILLGRQQKRDFISLRIGDSAVWVNPDHVVIYMDDKQGESANTTGGLNAGLPKRYADVGFDRPPVSNMNESVTKIAREYVADIHGHLERGEGLWLMGGTGTGKTALATLISKSALESDRTVAVYSLPRLLSEIRRTYDNDAGLGTLQLLDQLAAVDLLQIDDLGAEQPTLWVLEQLFSVINSRYEAEKAVIITTNLSPIALSEQIGPRTASRLEEMCWVVAIPDEVDHRKNHMGDGRVSNAAASTWGVDPTTAARPVRRREWTLLLAQMSRSNEVEPETAVPPFPSPDPGPQSPTSISQSATIPEVVALGVADSLLFAGISIRKIRRTFTVASLVVP